ncbi:hypothetical protein M2454_000760 [Aequitasia blattaphilus]|uniref:Uncharacterized protein n=1 Tax=Aequitasia blattaphilus TaxID=2949332 RepID=A0ABT1E813_9FIRM|nr:hypothetical protein [Aequitasia blattaphilus]MCP1101967.1 hypothetical protein [Aequitasia blattaphilus]MCR8614607.1 hypothetical protein [Aequitasia blattaphilus]
MRKTKSLWAYIDGEKLVDVVEVALDRNMMLEEVKQLLIAENQGHEVVFKIE